MKELVALRLLPKEAVAPAKAALDAAEKFLRCIPQDEVALGSAKVRDKKPRK